MEILFGLAAATLLVFGWVRAYVAAAIFLTLAGVLLAGYAVVLFSSTPVFHEGTFWLAICLISSAGLGLAWAPYLHQIASAAARSGVARRLR